MKPQLLVALGDFKHVLPECKSKMQVDFFHSYLLIKMWNDMTKLRQESPEINFTSPGLFISCSFEDIFLCCCWSHNHHRWVKFYLFTTLLRFKKIASSNSVRGDQDLKWYFETKATSVIWIRPKNRWPMSTQVWYVKNPLFSAHHGSNFLSPRIMLAKSWYKRSIYTITGVVLSQLTHDVGSTLEIVYLTVLKGVTFVKLKMDSLYHLNTGQGHRCKWILK